MQSLTIKDFKLIELTAGLEMFDSESDVVAGFYLNHPGAGLKVGKTVAGRLTHDDARGGCEYLVHGTRHCWQKETAERQNVNLLLWPTGMMICSCIVVS